MSRHNSDRYPETLEFEPPLCPGCAVPTETVECWWPDGDHPWCMACDEVLQANPYGPHCECIESLLECGKCDRLVRFPFNGDTTQQPKCECGEPLI